MSLDSQSTNEDVNAAYDDNCGYDLENDATKCRTFVKACRILIRRMAEQMNTGGSSVSDTYKKIQEELSKAEAWLRANDSSATPTAVGSMVRGFSFESFRR